MFVSLLIDGFVYSYALFGIIMKLLFGDLSKLPLLVKKNVGNEPLSVNSGKAKLLLGFPAIGFLNYT